MLAWDPLNQAGNLDSATAPDSELPSPVQVVAVPSTTSGEIAVGDESDWFRFRAGAGQQYVLSTSLGTLSDTTLALYSTDGTTLLASNDDFGDTLASRIQWTAPFTGVYYVKVAAFRHSQTGTYTLSVTGPPSTGDVLVLDIPTASIREGDSIQAIVMRSGSTASALLVSLQSNDTDEASVPSELTIPAGFSSTTFTVAAVDDMQLDGPQTVTISASASGYASGSDRVQVLDRGGGIGGDNPGSDAASAALLGVPSTTSGTIQLGGDNDWFRFRADAGQQYVLSTSLGTLSDTTLTLFSTDGTTVLEFNDDSGASYASRIDWTAPFPGVYYVKVAAYSSSQSGTYTLSVTGPPSTGGELTLDIAAASINENGGSTQATVTRTGSTANPLWVTLLSTDTGEASVPSAVVIPAGSTSAAFTVAGVNDTQLDGPQTVKITASAVSYPIASDTVLVLDNDGKTSGDDHGNHPATATSVAVLSTTPGNIEVSDDRDWFRFSAAAGVEYVISTSLDTLDDTTLILYGPDGVTVLASNDDFGDTLASRIQWTAPTAGVYYLRVAAYSASQTGTYALHVTTGAGGNVIFGSPEGDVIYAGAGNDIVYGGSGNDMIYGGDGNDILYGGPGNDVIMGGDGNDVLIGDGYDYFDGGPGVDRILDTYVMLFR